MQSFNDIGEYDFPDKIAFNVLKEKMNIQCLLFIKVTCFNILKNK